MEQNRATRYRKDSLTLSGTVMLGIGVTIGAGIFALTGQMALSLFSLAFLTTAAVIFSVPIPILKPLILIRQPVVSRCT